MPHLVAILTLFVSLVACLGYGSVWLRLLKRERDQDPLYLIQAVALGMGTLAYLILAVGLLRMLSQASLGILVAAGWLPALLALRGLKRPRLSTGEATGSPTAWATLFLFGFLGLLALVTLVSALKPADGLDWDGLSYHLAAPKIYLRDGRISFIAYDSHTHSPFTMEMLYTLGLAFGGAPGAKLFHWAAGWLTALAVGVWAGRIEVGGRRCPEWTGPAAAAAFASMPVVLWEMGTAYIELGTALFQFLALAALVDAVIPRQEGEASVTAARPRIDLAGAALAGMFTGFALGTKYTALLQFGLLGLGLLWVVARSGGGVRRSAVGATLAFGTLALLVASPWYVKNWLWVHNPVYPFFFHLFPGSYSWTPEAAKAYVGEQGTFGLGNGPAAAAKLFWNLGVNAREFYINERSLIGDKLGSVGPLWAGLLPLALWVRGPGRRVGAFGLYVLGSVGIWFFLSQQVRYLAPVFAPLAVVAAAVLAGLPAGVMRAAAGVFLGLTLVFNLGMHAPLAVSAVNVVSGQVSEEEYLQSSLPGLYEAVRYVNGLPQESRVALYQEARGFYFDREYFWANPLQHNLIPYERLRTGEELAAELKRFRITHVLINYDFSRGVEGFAWYRLLMHGIREGSMRETFRSSRAEFGRRGVMVYELR